MDARAHRFDADDAAARLREAGYVVIEDYMDGEDLAGVRAGLGPYLEAHRGRNAFEGFRTERVYTLVARGAVFEKTAAEPRLLAVLDRFLQPGYLLTASQAIAIHPGEAAQAIHNDDGFYRQPRPRPAISFTLIAAVDAFTPENGATEVIPGSHLWSDTEVAAARADARALAARLVPMAMPAGAAVLLSGTLLHCGRPGRGWRSAISIASRGRAPRRTSSSPSRANRCAAWTPGCSSSSATTSGRRSWAWSPPRTRRRRWRPTSSRQ